MRGLDRSRVDRAKLLMDLCREHGIIQEGHRLLEVGTGWVHWEATFLRLFFDIEITLFDIGDNRQIEPFRRYFSDLAETIDDAIQMPPEQETRVHGLLKKVACVKTFDELYEMLGFEYVIDPSGTLRQFKDDSFDVILSANVLEHVGRDLFPAYIQDFNRLLKPGGYSIHLIDLGDHLSYYDRAMSLKNYLRYSDQVWQRHYENEILYINRIQRKEWLQLFSSAGLELVAEQSTYCNLGSIRIDEKYEALGRRDLECKQLILGHRKPHRHA